MHVVTHLSRKYQAMRTPQNGWSIQEAGMAQLDDIVGSVMKYLKDKGLDENTIVVFTTDNGAENFTWPDGGQTPFAGGKGTALEGGFRVPCIVRWPGKVPQGKVENGIFSGLDWFPTFLAAAGNPGIREELLKGKPLGDRTYKVHLDGYNQTDLLTAHGPSKRREVFYFTESTLGAVRINDYKYRFTDQPNGWLAQLRRSIGRSWSISVWTPSSEPAYPTARPARWPITTGSCSSFGDSFMCSRRWPKSPRPSSSSPPRKRGQLSTWSAQTAHPGEDERTGPIASVAERPYSTSCR